MAQQGDGLQQASDAIGAKLVRITHQDTPETVQQAAVNALQQNPTAVFFSGDPTEWFSAQLDEMKALKPQVVVPGHMKPGTALDAQAIDFTRGYLVQFESALQQSKDSAGVIQAMRTAYPELGESASLELGAKVNKGEMRW